MGAHRGSRQNPGTSCFSISNPRNACVKFLLLAITAARSELQSVELSEAIHILHTFGGRVLEEQNRLFGKTLLTQ